MFDIVLGTGVFEGMSPEYLAICDRFLDEWNGRTASAGRRELDAVAPTE
ncbi:hypothetical protein [Mesorhizobium caraganae]